MVVTGIPACLTAAVIFSGGKVTLAGQEFVVPPLAVGIASLRDAMAPRRQKRSASKPKKTSEPEVVKKVRRPRRPKNVEAPAIPDMPEEDTGTSYDAPDYDA